MADQSIASIDNQNFDAFGFITFLHFLSKGGVITTAIAAIISDRCNKFLEAIVQNLIVPILNRDSDKDGKKDIADIENKVIDIGGIKLKVGKVMVEFLKFVIVTYIIYTIARLLDQDKALGMRKRKM